MIRLVLSPEEQARFEQTRRSRPQLAARCHSGLLHAQGWRVPQSARRLDRNGHPMRPWLKAYRTAGLPGLHHTPQSGRPATTGQRVAEQLARLFAHRPSHFGDMEAGWTVDLLRDYLAPPHAAVSEATVRRQLPAGAWVYKRFATTVPRHAPTAEKTKPGWQTLAPPSASAKRHGR